MASLLLPLLLLLLLHTSAGAPSPLLLRIRKDPVTLHYTTTVSINGDPLDLILDLGTPVSYLSCSGSGGHKGVRASAAARPVPCVSPLCSPPATCAKNSCALPAMNPITGREDTAPAGTVSVSLPTTDGRTANRSMERLPAHLVSCARTRLLKKIPRAAAGVLALGMSPLSFPAQARGKLSLPEKFALCLSGSPSAPGPGFLGSSGPYFFYPLSGSDVAATLTYVPLLPPAASGGRGSNYFVRLSGISVNNHTLAVNATTKLMMLSTAVPYTTMETRLYKAFIQAFSDEATAMGLPEARAVDRFDLCYDANDVGFGATGLEVPVVGLVLPGAGGTASVWRVVGYNSMVYVEQGATLCLGFVDGGRSAAAAVVVGGMQMEDVLVQFDVEGLRLGFSTHMLARGTPCANFNFTPASP